MPRLRRLVFVGVAMLMSCAIAAGVVGFYLFNRPHIDPLAKADAIVVLGGEWDNRVAYGLDLARSGYADTVVLSDSYIGHREDMRRACEDPIPGVTVICFTPQPYTTRGEAIFTSELAAEHHWSHVIVVSWNYHMVRARYIFSQCFAGGITMRPVPRTYDKLGVLKWSWIYAYQYAALAKATIMRCQ